MEKLIKNNINIIIALFILIQPLLDFFTGLCLHVPAFVISYVLKPIPSTNGINIKIKYKNKVVKRVKLLILISSFKA